jgi:hypothetical protein
MLLGLHTVHANAAMLATGVGLVHNARWLCVLYQHSLKQYVHIATWLLLSPGSPACSQQTIHNAAAMQRYSDQSSTLIES